MLKSVQTLRSMMGEKAEMTSKSQSFQNYSSRLIEVDDGGTLGRQLNIEHPRGMYGIGASIVNLESDVAEIFPNSKAFNEALRFLVRITRDHRSEFPLK